MPAGNAIQQLGDVPVQTPVSANNGNFTLGWIQWFQAVYQAIKYLAAGPPLAQLILTGPTPTVASGQVGFGASAATSASAGPAVLPASPLGFLIANVDGQTVKIPFYAP